MASTTGRECGGCLRPRRARGRIAAPGAGITLGGQSICVHLRRFCVGRARRPSIHLRLPLGTTTSPIRPPPDSRGELSRVALIRLRRSAVASEWLNRTTMEGQFAHGVSADVAGPAISVVQGVAANGGTPGGRPEHMVPSGPRVRRWADRSCPRQGRALELTSLGTRACPARLVVRTYPTSRHPQDARRPVAARRACPRLAPGGRAR